MTIRKTILSLFIIGQLTSILICNMMILKDCREKLDLEKGLNSILKITENAVNVLPNQLKSANRIYTTYAGITGYGFFSPNPPYSYSLFFELENEFDQKTIIPFQMGSYEGNKRKETASNYFNNEESEDIKTLLAQSLATRIHAIHEPKSIRVFGVSHIIPSMKDYRAGEKPYFILQEEYIFSTNP